MRSNTLSFRSALASLAFVAIAATGGNALAEDAAPDAEQLMKQAHLNLYYAGDDGKAVVTMTLEDKNGKTRSRKFVMVRKDYEVGGAQKYYTYFLEPADVQRTSFTVWKETDKDDSRWIFVPAVDLVKRISAKDKGSSFVGSDFSYEDVSGRPWTHDAHTFVREDTLDGVAVWVIESRPKDSGDVFAKKITWIDRERMLPIREEYYDSKDRHAKTFRAESIEEVGGYLTVTKRSMTNELKNHKTTVEFSGIVYDVGIMDDAFTERALKNPPADLVRM
jgi:outer membrane lipoprotein-sorting protein